jgi:hypothetical protein
VARESHALLPTYGQAWLLLLVLDILPSLSHDLGHIRAGVMVASLCQESRHAHT